MWDCKAGGSRKWSLRAPLLLNKIAFLGTYIPRKAIFLNFQTRSYRFSFKVTFALWQIPPSGGLNL